MTEYWPSHTAIYLFRSPLYTHRLHAVNLSKSQRIVYRDCNLLPGPEIPPRPVKRAVAQQEIDLFEIPRALPAELTIATETTATPRTAPKAKSEAACISAARIASLLHCCNYACASISGESVVQTLPLRTNQPKTVAHSPTRLYLLTRLTHRRIPGDNPGLIQLICGC